MDRSAYQAVSSTQSVIFVNMVRHYLTTPGLAFTFLPVAEPEFWAPLFAYANLTRLPDADFEIGGRRYGTYGHDWRAVPPMAWLDLLAEREIAAGPQPVAPPPTTETLVVLSQEGFAAAVRDALRDYARPDVLRQNPLVRSRLVVEHTLGADRSAALQHLLRQAAEALQASPREAKLYRAVYHTYFQPLATQEQVAERLDLPFSTYRRHLKAGVTRLVDILWQQEIGAGAA
jgi:hypothetical protein